MSERWYQTAVVYCVEVDAFQDSDGDGCGDLRGLTRRLDYLARLGVTCLWLNPIHPSPGRDNGYDVSDYYGVDPRLGTLGDFTELTTEAHSRGIRVLLDLVVNHTSDEHPWFRSARSDPDSPYRDWYVWSATEPADRRQGIVFPGEQDETWTWDDEAGAWYFHRFYAFQPDLNWSNPRVRAEIAKVMAFWLQLGASGFRIDAAPFVLEQTEPDRDPAPHDFGILDEWRQEVQWRKGDAVLLCEANVPRDELPKYCTATERPDGPNDRAHMLFAFAVNAPLWLALAREDAEPLIEAVNGLPRLPRHAQWVTFLRNHDELDLSTLTQEQRADVMAAFAPDPDMRIYERGIRRRLAPMLGGDRRRIEMAYSLQFTMPGTPVLRYGEEIGMGEDLALPGRESIRTPMQWHDDATGGFSTAAPDALVRPVLTKGDTAPARVNVDDQERDPDSLLRWFEQLIRALRECPEIGTGTPAVVDVPAARSVIVHRFDVEGGGSVVLLHNLSGTPVALEADVRDRIITSAGAEQVFADGEAGGLPGEGAGLPLSGWGYRWIRLRTGVTSR